MKRIAMGLLALGLAATSQTGFAQSSYDRYGDDGYSRNGSYSNDDSYYDYARVIRVDPVLDGYRSTGANAARCRETTTAGRYESDGYYRNDGYSRNDGYDDGYERRSYGGNSGGRTAATIVGGIAGAVLGSKIGGGTGTTIATVAGSALGSLAGREIYDQNQRNRYVRGGTVRVCEPEPVYGGYSRYGSTAATAYDVTYEYNGRRYTRRMDYNPGDRLRVRVDVMPQ
ncbi:glycine zipper 2TM domain-containing protein [Thermomonas sp.]|uniref:glycine zipper 2TM domain-containing protein n=1 Tax=Thermomonas sp. TaxID=1971895 RepID=UPI0026233B34|nr:glycine zipper 2TM domain-containing protein [Thermomonas sp.]